MENQDLLNAFWWYNCFYISCLHLRNKTRKKIYKWINKSMTWRIFPVAFCFVKSRKFPLWFRYPKRKVSRNSPVKRSEFPEITGKTLPITGVRRKFKACNYTFVRKFLLKMMFFSFIDFLHYFMTSKHLTRKCLLYVFRIHTISISA